MGNRDNARHPACAPQVDDLFPPRPLNALGTQLSAKPGFAASKPDYSARANSLRKHEFQPLNSALFQKNRSTDLDYIYGESCVRISLFDVPTRATRGERRSAFPSLEFSRTLRGFGRQFHGLERSLNDQNRTKKEHQPMLSPTVSTTRPAKNAPVGPILAVKGFLRKKISTGTPGNESSLNRNYLTHAAVLLTKNSKMRRGLFRALSS